MNSAAAAPRKAPSALQKTAGTVLTLLILLGFPDTTREMSRMGSGWAIGGIVTGLFLLVAAIRNWGLLWNPLGNLLRKLLGERGARMSLGLVGLAFALFAANALINPDIPDCLGPRISAEEPVFAC